MSRLRMSGAINPHLHTPSWSAQGQICIYSVHSILKVQVFISLSSKYTFTADNSLLSAFSAVADEAPREHRPGPTSALQRQRVGFADSFSLTTGSRSARRKPAARPVSNRLADEAKERWGAQWKLCSLLETEWRRLQINELYEPYSSSNIRVIKLRRMNWAGHVAGMRKRKGSYMILVGKHEGRRPLGRPRRRWENIISMDLR